MLERKEGGRKLMLAEIREFQQRHGLTLPASYENFLLQTNGGRPTRDLFAVPDSPEKIARLHFFFEIGDPDGGLDLDLNVSLLSNRIPASLLPIATTEGADKICLTVAGPMAGQVVYWDGYGGGALFPVAPSFEAFVAMLYRDEHSP